MKVPTEIKENAEKYFKTTLESTAFIFKSLLQLEIKPKRLYAKRLNSLPRDMIISIDFKADKFGFFSFFFSIETAFYICQKLVPDMNSTVFSDDHLDILGELGNMISGNTLGKLQLVNKDLRLDTPELSPFHKILISESKYWHFSSNIDIDKGKMGILLCMEK